MSIADDAGRIQGRPFSGNALAPLKAGQEYRYIRARSRERRAGIDAEEAIAKARKMTWWPAVIVEMPKIAAGWWIFTIETARLP